MNKIKEKILEISKLQEKWFSLSHIEEAIDDQYLYTLSLGRWGLEELKMYLLNHPDIPYEVSLEKFRKILEKQIYKMDSEEKKASFISMYDSLEYLLNW